MNADQPAPPEAVPDTDVANVPPAMLEAGERGRTSVADKVVEKIAAAAAGEVDAALGLRRHLAGRAVGASSVRAQARIEGRTVGLQLELAVRYPQPIRATTRAVRAHVSAQVSRLCALHVDHIDITVAALQRPDTDRSRVR